MPVDGIDNGAEIHIGNGKRGILFKAGGEHEQQITELINVLDVCRRKVLPDTVCFGKQQQMLILFVDLLCMPIGVGVIEMLRRRQGNDIFRIEADLRVKRFREDVVHVCRLVQQVCRFQMFGLPVPGLIVENAEEACSLIGLVAVVILVDFNGMRYRILFPSDAFGLVGIDVPKVGAVVHQHIVGDEIGREISAFRATGIVRVCQWIKYFGEDAAAFQELTDFGVHECEIKERVPDLRISF